MHTPKGDEGDGGAMVGSTAPQQQREAADKPV